MNEGHVSRTFYETSDSEGKLDNTDSGVARIFSKGTPWPLKGYHAAPAAIQGKQHPYGNDI